MQKNEIINMLSLSQIDKNNFTEVSLELFNTQYNDNQIYRKYVDLLNIDPKSVDSLGKIPFLPIDFFKTHTILSQKTSSEITFLSSGTTKSIQSKHYVADLKLYEESFTLGFEKFYGKIDDYTILALLPSYLEREGSSLIYMVDELIKKTNNPNSGFYLHNHQELFDKLLEQETKKKKTLLIGVSFALLDFTETFSCNLKHTIVMETGGMKGRRKEMIREELHKTLQKGFGLRNIHSEYGMTELLSQAYYTDTSSFHTPPWMKIMIRDTEDPLSLLPNGKTGGINVIDLANKYSCAFIATQDLGKLNKDGSFQVLGRFDNSDIRGCNLLIQ